jgi:hypothetical protein
MTPPRPSPSLPPPHRGPAGRRFSAGAVSLFHAYGNWLVGITWMRFALLSVLLLISAEILSKLPPFNLPIGSIEQVTITPPSAAQAAEAAQGRAARTSRHRDREEGHATAATSRSRSTRTACGSRRAAARAPLGGGSSAPASALGSVGGAPARISLGDVGVEIKLPPGRRQRGRARAVEEARQAVVEAIRDSQQAPEEAAAEAAEQASQQTVTAGPAHPPHADGRFVHRHRLPPDRRLGDPQDQLQGHDPGRGQGRRGDRDAESEQLKRQVVEARMAAMQAQVEPHFLFNTLASIDHLIQTDPPRASQMQKNLIALLRASMPSMRESTPMAHNLGREMAVIRPYLEILKVRMEERLQTDIQVPEGCCRPSSRR